jgi:GT2 family glycosyltransferase
VGFCLRVADTGYRVAWTPFAQLYHWESATRSHDVDPQELAYMEGRWGERLVQDPYYNPNLSLTRFDYGLRL